MIVGLGMDLIEIDRVRAAIERHGERILRRLFTEGERAYCERRGSTPAHYAARFAAKEAAFKALGTGWRGGIAWTDAEVRNERSGKPLLLLHRACEERARELGAVRVHLTLTHARDLAGAVVVLESD